MKIISRLIYFAVMITIISIALFFNQRKANAAEEPIMDYEHDFLVIEAEEIAELNRLIGNETISRVLGLNVEIDNEDELAIKLIDPSIP